MGMLGWVEDMPCFADLDPTWPVGVFKNINLCEKRNKEDQRGNTSRSAQSLLATSAQMGLSQ